MIQGKLPWHSTVIVGILQGFTTIMKNEMERWKSNVN